MRIAVVMHQNLHFKLAFAMNKCMSAGEVCQMKLVLAQSTPQFHPLYNITSLWVSLLFSIQSQTIFYRATINFIIGVKQ
jgi:ABC-type cobalt transport system substrate-binding protein